MENYPKNLIWVLGIMLAVFLGLASVQKGFELNSKIANKNPEISTTVSAEGKVKAVPDTATLSAGLITNGSSAEAAQKENSNKVNKIIEFVKSKGVPADDISTSQYSIYPNYNYEAGNNVITGYQVNQTITVKLKEVNGKNKEMIGTILSGVTANGANQINGVTLGFDDPDDLRQQAREQAISKAKEKAMELAKASGIKLGRVINVSEAGSDGITPYYYGEGMGGGGAVMDKSASPNIELGQQDVVVTMSVTFEVK